MVPVGPMSSEDSLHTLTGPGWVGGISMLWRTHSGNCFFTPQPALQSIQSPVGKFIGEKTNYKLCVIKLLKHKACFFFPFKINK